VASVNVFSPVCKCHWTNILNINVALLSCRVRCLYHCIYHLLLANKVMMMMILVTVLNDSVMHGSSLNSVPEQGDFCAETFQKVV